MQPSPPQQDTPGGTRRVTQSPDSAPILRADFDTRKVDTIGRIKILAGDKRIRTEAAGRTHTQVVVNPLQSIDEWTTLPDGSVAFVRGHDYHIDWLATDGTPSSSPRMPFDWRRLTDGDKQKLVDSARAFRLGRDSVIAAARAAGGAGAGVVRIEAAGRDVMVADNSTTETVFVPLSEMPDYQPPIRTGAVRADLDGNVWILPTTTAQSRNGELVYDVVNRRGELFERVRLPEGRSIAGFGRAGVIYLMWRDGANGWFIERTRVLR
jgi:hypothetical protein